MNMMFNWFIVFVYETTGTNMQQNDALPKHLYNFGIFQLNNMW